MKKLLCIIFLFIAVPAWAGPGMIQHDYEYSIMDADEEAAAIPMHPVLDLFGIRDLPCPPSPYVIWEEPNTTEYPNSAIGKIFFRRGDGKTYVCSGALVDNDVLLTAGHCVYYQGQWATGLYFAPGYRDKAAPLGWYRAVTAFVWDPWVLQGSWNYDYAMVVLEASPGDRAGVLGTAWSETPWQLFRQAGYPSTLNDGQRLWINEAATGLVADFFGVPSPIWTGTGSGPGSSGGPWVINKNGELKINSVSSCGYANCSNMIQGPYFDASFPLMLDAAKAYK